jgi:hypothetical protein
MKTLLKIGDVLKIRDDIKYHETEYRMMHENDFHKESYTPNMMPPGSIVTISDIKIIQGHTIYKIAEDPIFNYVDEMFDQELMKYLYNNR